MVIGSICFRTEFSSLREGSKTSVDDYYSGPNGARRLMNELDVVLQHLLDNLERADSLKCAIALQLADGESVELNKTYRQKSKSRRERA